MTTLILRTVAAGGLRPEFEHTRTCQRRAVQTPEGSLSPRSRQINERKINRYTFVWKHAQTGTRFLVRDMWRLAGGCVMPMLFTPCGKTDADVEEVKFVPKSLKIHRAGPVTSAIEFEVESVH